MKTLMMAIGMLVALGAMSDVNAAPPKPPADCGLDADGDGWCVPDPNRNDFHLGDEDCNDADPRVNPGAAEIVGDGFDQDCDGDDLVAPAYTSKFRCGLKDARCIAVMEAEIAVCNTDDECTVSFSEGLFKTTFGHYFVDRKCDGKREVVDQAAYDTFLAETRAALQNPSWVPRADGRCSSTQRSTVRKSGGGGKGSSGSSVSNKKLTELEGMVGENTTKLGALDTKVTTVEDNLGKTLDLIEGWSGELRKAEAAVRKETSERKADVARIDLRVQGVVGETLRLDQTVRKMAEVVVENRGLIHDGSQYGINFGVTFEANIIGQKSVTVGDVTARGSLATAPYFGLNIGGETPEHIFRAFGGVGVPFETGPSGGNESGMLWKLGVEALWKLDGDHAIGAMLYYLDHDSGATIVEQNAKARGGLIGVAWEYSMVHSGRFCVPFRASLSAGYQALGTMGDDFVATGGGPVMIASLGVGASLCTPPAVVDNDDDDE